MRGPGNLRREIPRRGRTLIALPCAIGLALLLVLVVVPTAIAQTRCPSRINASEFASAARLRKLVSKENSFGQRILASSAHKKTIDWIEEEVQRIGFRAKSDPFSVYRWLPRTAAKDGPGLDIGRAGGLSVTRPNGSKLDIPDAGAVHWSKPTGKKGRRGPLVYLGPDEDITASNAAGKVVIRDFPSGSLPYGSFQFVGLYITPDLASETGSYARPYINTIHEELVAAGQAGAAGVVFAFDVPREQVEGYYDPHTGTLFRVPAVFVGHHEAEQLKSLAPQNASARVVVRASVDRETTRNLIATLPGRSPQRIVLAANTDGNSWVQEDGVGGLLALGRYYADLPLRCRPRTLVLLFASAHDTLVKDGTDRYAEKLDRQYNRGTVAFAFALEHLGTREILPTGQGSKRRLVFTGKGEPFLFAAGDSNALRNTAVTVTKRRRLDRTAVLRGLGVPDPSRVPPICSMGGLGNAFHLRLIPTLAMISGPWSLYDPAFGSRAIDFRRMRLQLLAAGDAVLALDSMPRNKIAGDYLHYREQRDQGAPTCPKSSFPQFAPGPGD